MKRKASSPLERSVERIASNASMQRGATKLQALFRGYRERPKVIVDRIMRRVLRKRRSGKTIAFMVYRRLQSMGKQADRPCSAHSRNTKVKWYGLGIADRRIRRELQRRLRAAHYTCKFSTLVSKEMRLPSVHVLTYN